MAEVVSLGVSGGQQDFRDFARAFDMTVVAGVQFGDVPSSGTGLVGEGLEEWSRRIMRGDAGNEGGGQPRLVICR